MLNINITNFRKNINEYLEETIKHEPIKVSTKMGNVIILSEEDYNVMMETVKLTSMPKQYEKIIEGLHTPLNECLSEDEVQW